MTRSMTGFGAATGEAESISFSVEVRSVNNRYLKGTIKLPENFAAVEGEIDRLLRTRLARGSVTVSVRAKFLGDQAAYQVNADVLSRYLDQLKVIESEANPTLRIDLGAMLQLPGVCEPPSMEEMLENAREPLLAVVNEAIDRLLEMRAREGAALETDLLANCDVIEQSLAQVAGRAPAVLQEYHDRLADRVQQLTRVGNLKIDEDTLAREVAIFAERCDVAEELTRLGGHVKQFREVLSGEEAGGRKLDFIAQEMLREANTIGSKSNDGEITRRVVEIKTAVDRIKEQVQNVE
ncbi:MAG TPA: YicC family protein [Phycisphaerae bacterium]|nr:YicC family protein [Phycisphaerae bacterium]